MFLISCGFQTYVNLLGADWYRQFFPLNTTTCQCKDSMGSSCVAWCVNYKVPGFEIVNQVGAEFTQANCSNGNKALGCHIVPVPGSGFDPKRFYYPNTNGSGCTCETKYGSTCIATCASGIQDYEINILTGVLSVFTPCKIPGNVVLGCGQMSYFSDVIIEQWPSMKVSNQTLCVCYNFFGVTCFAMCGKLLPA